VDTLDIIQHVDLSILSNAFGIENNSFLTLIIGSFIVGYICLTFYYKIYFDQDNEKWTKLEFSEKVIVSLFIGFLTILVSLFAVATWQLYYNDKVLEKFFLQLYYVSPFLYFKIISAFTHKENYKELVFIKKYILISIKIIMGLVFIFTFSIFYLIRDWHTILALILLIVLCIIGMMIKPKIENVLRFL